MNRRKFLLSSGGLLGLTVVGEFPGMRLLANADESLTPGGPKKFFVLIRAQLGWDVTLGLDPQIMPAGCTENDMFIEYRPEDIFSSGTLRLGPAATAMRPYASSMATVNGVFMSDSNVDHGRNLNYATAGSTNDGSASLAVDIASHSSVGRFGVIFDADLNTGDNPTVMTTTFTNLNSLANGVSLNSIRDFLASIGNGGALGKAQSTYLNGSAEIDALKSLMTARNSNSQNSGDRSYTTNNAILAASGFASGCANQAQFTISEDLDTHSDHPVRHLKGQTKVWEQVASICDAFKQTPFGSAGSNLFDHTTFMVVSEFSRTPALDGSRGKDHNPFTNSVLLMGNGIVGESSIGQSHLIPRNRTANGIPRHVSSLYNYESGKTASSKVEASQHGYEFIRPENIAATVRSILGLGSPDESLALKRIIKSV